MKTTVVSIMIVSILTAPLRMQALEVHPLKKWLKENHADRREVNEKKAGSQARKNAWKGAIIGGLLAGGRAAILHQDVGKAVAVGAAAGAVAGYLIGRVQDIRLADRDQLAQRVAYDPNQGYRAEVTRMSCDPCNVKPGQTFSITISYWAMGPQRMPLSFSRHLGLAVDDIYVKVFTFDPDPFTMEEGGGEFETTLEYKIDKEGTYRMDWLVENDQNAIQQAGSANIVVSSAG